MEDYFVEKANRKGLGRVLVEQVAEDVNRVLMVKSGKHYFPGQNIVEEMIERYNVKDGYKKKIFNRERFGKDVELYEGILEEMAEKGELPDFDEKKLRKFRVNLLSYCEKHKGW